MPTVKIIRATDNVFPAQQVKLAKDILTIQTYKGGQKLYPIKNSIVSLDIVSQHWRNTLFDVELCDGSQFRGEAPKGVVHRLIKFAGASPHKVEERTAKQVRQQARWTTARWVGIPLLLMVLVMAGSNPNTAPKSHDYFINGANWHGCTDEEVYDKVIELAVQGDRVALAKYLTAGTVLGACTTFKAGEPVYIAKSGLLKKKVRRPGQTTEYWISSDAVK